MRLFAGIAVAPAILKNLENLLAELRPVAALKWSPVENLHITTRFIGEWPEARLEEMRAALAAVPCPGPITIGIHGFGYLPNPHQPRIFFAAVKTGPELAGLAAATDTALESLGLPREARPYHPHLTLARMANDNIRQLRERIANMKNPDFGSFEAPEFHLYLSSPGPQGSLYTKLSAFPLAGRWA